MTEDFSQYPVSLAERRGVGAHEWTPRDVLISMLRRLDSGEITTEALIIIYEDAEGGSCYSVSSPGSVRTVGMMECAKHAVLENSYPKP
jgi:hypothetical protein